ncbi:acyl-CoA synthetase [Nocardia sp. CA-151230]|uniref:acyl-CoA synthetase n=1 Tax=Nocardia sp. CA-151230 TaxID=3239982 RepID=UPI003D934A35
MSGNRQGSAEAIVSEKDLPPTTYEILIRSARAHPERPALHLLPDGDGWDEPVTWTYRDLAEQVTRAANLYVALGLEPGGVVGLLLPNTGATYAALLGAQAVGIANPVNPMLATEHIIEIMRLTGVRILLAPAPELDADGWQKACSVAEALPELQALISVGGGTRAAPRSWVGDFDQLAAVQPSDRLNGEHRRGPGDIAAYFHTGGTTGVPKVAPHTHAGEIYVAWALGEHEAFGGDTVVLTGLPLFHVNAILVSTLTPLLRGGAIVSLGALGYRDRAAMADFWRIVQRYRITTFSAVPTVYASLPPVPADVDVSSMRAGIVGAAPLPARVRADFEAATGVPMVEGYGLTEGTCANTFSPVCGGRVGSVGQALPYQEVKAVRLTGNGLSFADCETGETGVLAIKGPSVFPGYLRSGPAGPRPDPSGVILDGWLITGDLGRVDTDGFVYLTGREKDVIIRGGHNIDPQLVEEALLAHPDVAGAAVVSRPDPHSGEVPAAYLVLRSGANPGIDELRQWAIQHSPEPAATPKFLHTVEAIPVTAVGKVNKVVLRHDSVNRVIQQELHASDLRADISVKDRNGQAHADIQLPADVHEQGVRALVTRLNAYSFSYELHCEHLDSCPGAGR